MSYIVTMSSDEYRVEEFPSDTEPEAIKTLQNLMHKAASLQDGIDRTFSIRKQPELVLRNDDVFDHGIAGMRQAVAQTEEWRPK